MKLKEHYRKLLSRDQIKSVISETNIRGIEVSPIADFERPQFEEFLSQHYLGKTPRNISEQYGVFYNGVMVGVIAYGTPTSTNIYRELELGRGEVLELRRLYIMDDIEVHNIESQVISLGNRELMINRPDVKVVLTFADPKAGHLGTVYQATNAIYLGAKPKHKYIYILRNRKQILRRISPQDYPK